MTGSVKPWAAALIILGFAIAFYKIDRLGFPVNPDQQAEVWIVQATLSYTGKEKPAKVSLELPSVTPGFALIDEDFISNRYGLVVDRETEDKRANWAIRRARNEQRLYYRITLAEDRDSNSRWNIKPPFPTVPDYPEPYQSAIRSILDDVRTASADVDSFTQELLAQLNSNTSNENIDLLRDRANNVEDWADEIIKVLAGVRIPARKIWGFNITTPANNLHLTPLLQVHNGREWLTYHPKTSAKGLPRGFLVWQVGDRQIVSVTGGRNPKVEFSVTRSHAKLIEIASKNRKNKDSFFVNYTLLDLPVKTQNTYQLLLMVPLGALIVVLLRTFVGLQTFGTFMPILIALAFRETQLFWGVVAFTMIVSIGLMIRFFLERLRLLLVPRLTTILTIVIIIMLVISQITYHLEIERLVSISLFPMVILAMTIERMSIVWEESGAGQAMLQAFGSLAVAILGYLVMINENLAFIMFVYPESLLVVLGVSLLAGRYTGYRLSELIRFRDMAVKESV